MPVQRAPRRPASRPPPPLLQDEARWRGARRSLRPNHSTAPKSAPRVGAQSLRLQVAAVHGNYNSCLVAGSHINGMAAALPPKHETQTLGDARQLLRRYDGQLLHGRNRDRGHPKGLRASRCRSPELDARRCRSHRLDRQNLRQGPWPVLRPDDSDWARSGTNASCCGSAVSPRCVRYSSVTPGESSGCSLRTA